ncbi:DUF169 domain-containing protein [Desulfovibrio sulfodismutans]|uniref:DUF169 domain-containing protein n=1 Tax=Desulfolutivibrio sulfodismutans TaxID=63561 RepID=A0A7K3NQT1_9BACT|nr:DUF169 domain-containing protein [Desulfolutivibrio sulfodismutans]NDY58548.1 DUF169 domain-containing protein [Desulfolutivibrio sulfodismutans]QLA13909.1 hypothetical protein GD606_17390 [Desulfolutivibrio sulfodismutans DSM 3696]
MNDILEQTSALIEDLGHDEEPVGIFYTDAEPGDGFVPKPGVPFNIEMEAKNEIDWKGLWGNFSCVLGKVWLARRQRKPAYFEATRYGCPGGSFFLGFHKPQIHFLDHYISLGIPNVTEGEFYLPSPQHVRAFFDAIDPRPAPARFCVIKPLSLFCGGETPELVAFFSRGEVLGGLCQLAFFATGDPDVVALPFGAGCSNLVTWPLRYLETGRPRAVVGGMDPSCRKFLKADELSFCVPIALYRTMLAARPESFLKTKTWAGVRTKVLRSRRAWGEMPED